MAKQSGLHQIRGKVGEHSYYRQTGVASGLIRSINQGMSERVKTAEEYANVRLNNAEFGQAGRISKVLGMLISPKYRPMLLPFSQSKMCKVLLEAIKADSEKQWGQRNLTSDSLQSIFDALRLVCKNDPDEYGVSFTMDGSTMTVEADDSLSSSKLLAIGADGYRVRVVAASPWIGEGIGANRYQESYARANIYDIDGLVPSSSEDVTPVFRPSPAAGLPWMEFKFYLFIIMPYRSVNGRDYILQEHCTYMVSDVPA